MWVEGVEAKASADGLVVKLSFLKVNIVDVEVAWYLKPKKVLKVTYK